MNFLIKIYERFLAGLDQVKLWFKNLFFHLFTKVYFSIIFSINVFLFLAAYLMSRRLDHDFAILHYNTDFGIDLIGPKTYLFFLPAASLLFTLINQAVLIKLCSRPDFKFWAYFLLSFLLLFNIFLLLILFTIYTINF